MTYTVGKMAKIMGVAPSTLRYYDNEGLLPFVGRTEGGKRVFTDSDYEGLKVIDCLKRAGLSIKEIRHFIQLVEEGDASIKDRLALFEERKQVVEQQLCEMQETLHLLEFKCWYYKTALNAGTEKAVKGLTYDSVPSEYKSVKRSLNIEAVQNEIDKA